MAVPSGDRVNGSRIWPFLAWTFGICWGMAGVLYLAQVKYAGPVAMVIGMVYMLVPGSVVIVLARRWGVPLREYGLVLRFRWALLLAMVLPLLLTVAAVALSAALGWAELDLSGELIIEQTLQSAGQGAADQLRQTIERTPSMRWVILLSGFLSAIVAGLTINLFFALGEELGWRGLLQRELAPLGFAKSSLLIGAIWGLWHAPLIAQGHNYPEHPLPGVGMMVVWCMVMGVVVSWVRLRAGTVLAAAVMHGTINGIAGLGLLTLRGGSDLMVGLTGLSGIITVSVVAVLMLPAPPRTDEDESTVTQTDTMEGQTDG